MKDQEETNWGKNIFIVIIILVILGFANMAYQKHKMNKMLDTYGISR